MSAPESPANAGPPGFAGIITAIIAVIIDLIIIVLAIVSGGLPAIGLAVYASLLTIGGIGNWLSRRKARQIQQSRSRATQTAQASIQRAQVRRSPQPAKTRQRRPVSPQHRQLPPGKQGPHAPGCRCGIGGNALISGPRRKLS